MPIIDGFAYQTPDMDPAETLEWLQSFDAVLDEKGKARARYLLIRLLERARQNAVGFPATVSTHYINSIPASHEPPFPGDEHIERRIRAYIRWNAAAMVIRANILHAGLGGHLATFASSASLYEVGFNHFFRGRSDTHHGDQVFIQGHASPGVYARAFLEGRLNEDHLDHFRREVGAHGLSSYPHPRLMPDFWEFPTVSMGLGPLTSIYQARFNRYLHNRSIVDTSDAKVWAFIGDGETDEPETLGSISLAARECLDNLIWVVNCNLQRLDGPVRGNGKIIQELEAMFRGAGWNVIKVIWGRRWDELLAQDVDGVLVAKMDSTVDGEFQRYAVDTGAYIREHFFGPDERLQQMVAHLSDEELRMLPRGGHDYRKLYAAYRAAVEHEGSPTVILAKTVKGWTLGPDIEARNVTHQIKKMTRGQLMQLRERLSLHEEVPDPALDEELPPYVRAAPGSEIYEYMMERRLELGGSLPRRAVRRDRLAAPSPSVFDDFLRGSGNREVSTTVAFTGMLRNLLRDDAVGARVVPIIPDEARTFGMDPLFSEFKIYSSVGQRYEPVDAAMVLAYREATNGVVLEEGITEAGAMSSMQAAGTSYATWGEPMIPFFILYSMFGFQRIGDLIWQFGDIRGRGFLMGGTAGRTTLTGEGLQHTDGHSLALASVVPNLRAYDPAFAYETALIVRDGIQRMYGGGSPFALPVMGGDAVHIFGERDGALGTAEDCFYYITLYNENYAMPPAPDGCEEGVVRGLYRFAPAPEGYKRRATILFSGPMWRAAMDARRILADEWDVACDLYSATSYKALREEALWVERWNRLHPLDHAKVPYVTSVLSGAHGPFVAVSDFMKAVPDQIARWVPGPYVVLGTDGYGRSDTREHLRKHFEVDAGSVVIGVLHGLMQQNEAKGEEVVDAIRRYGIDPDRLDPRLS